MSADNTNSLGHPPSRLSPPPGSDLSHLFGQGPASAGPSNYNIISGGSSIPPQVQPGTSGISGGNVSASTSDSKKKKDEKDGNVPKRGYRACVHCRLRKAKCDLGDVNAPSEPPCSRCRREQRDCVFLPSKRRRKTSTAAEGALREASADPSQAEVYPAHAASTSASTSNSVPAQNQQNPPPPAQPIIQHPQYDARSNPSPDEWNIASLSHILQPQVDDRNHAIYPPSTSSSSKWPDNFPQAQSGPSTALPSQNQMLPPPTSQPSLTPQHNPDTTTPGSMGESSVASTTGQSPNQHPHHRAKKRRTAEPDGTRKIVNASLSNEMDALEILANAATDENGEIDDGTLTANKNKLLHHLQDERLNGDTKRVSWDISEEPSPVRELEEFHLIRNGILDEGTLQELVTIFFRDHHPSLPIFQTSRIPRTRDQLLDLAHNDSFLLTCIVAVASRHPVNPRYREIHDSVWPILRDTMSDYTFAGLPGSVGFVEGVLLLAEHLPRETPTMPKPYSLNMLAGPGSEVTGEHGTDNRRSWSLTGLAIRAAYLLGLDQIALEINEDERTPDVERVRSVWTWCYLYDRTIAFWSRGPSLCFIGYSHISQTGEAAARYNFPLQLSPGTGNENDDSTSTHDDSASLMQALVELTQIMTNAHDILYPSKSRTAVLVRQGEYFLFLDHFRRALDSYRTIWKPKKWSNQTLHELSWMTYQFVRLYISSFGYSAHVKRAQWRAEAEAQSGKEGARQSVQLFPRGSATSPDAIYIYESIGSANEIMAIALRLSQMGSLRFLPSRYLINISYAAVFALKSSYSGAVTGKDMIRIRELVDHVCAALVLACPDKDHPANKYGQMLRMLSKKLEQLSDASAVPSRFPSPEPMSSTPLPTNSQTHPHTETTPLPWTLPTETMETQPMPFQFPPFEFNFLPSNQNTTSNNNTSTTPTYLPPSTIPGTGDYVANLGLGLGAASANISQNSLNNNNNGGNNNNNNNGGGAGAGGQEGLFDFDTNFDFDLKGFWDDFTLGEGSGFPFR